MTHEDKNIGGTKGNFASDEEKISNLLSGLKRVEAPKDLEFHVRSRIARSTARGQQGTSWFPVLKYGMPLLLFLMIGGVVLWNSSLFDRVAPDTAREPVNAGTEVVAAQPQQTQPELPGTSEVNSAREETVASVTEDQPVREPEPVRDGEPARRPAERIRDTPPASTDGSTDLTVRAAPTPINPPGMQGPETNVRRDPGEMAPKPEPIKDALQSIGVTVESVEGALVVRSVSAGGFGSELGIKAGDRIEAIDGRPVNDKSVFEKGAFKVKTVKVKRGATVMNLQVRKSGR